MKTLPQVTPTSEQLTIISNPIAGVQLIRGAAGSGKTTTALLMLRQLSSFWLRRRRRLGLTQGINILVLTYNRTLRGYIQELADSQIQNRQELSLTVSTFARWSKEYFPLSTILDDNERRAKIEEMSSDIPLEPDFINDEVEYLLGRFHTNDLNNYITCTRDGRGITPRVNRNLRRRLMDEVVYPYIQWKGDLREDDWNDLAIKLLDEPASVPYQIILADEAQDLSANQVRAIMHYADNPSSVIFILDAAQRIYPRGFTWTEAGVSISRIHRLSQNYRNTQEICRFAAPLLEGLDIGDDGTFPDFNTCTRSGELPLVIDGLYSEQVDYVINHIISNIDLSQESVAFLKPRGGAWFNYLRSALVRRGLDYVEMTRRAEWPVGNVNIGLSTMHSAKGLEFDHVFILGLNDEVTPYGEEEGDTTFENLRRMLSMSITRARESVILGYKPGIASGLISLLDSSTYRRETL